MKIVAIRLSNEAIAGEKILMIPIYEAVPKDEKHI